MTDIDLSHLAPLDLDTLVAAASLQTRVDRKYVLRRADADAVTRALAALPTPPTVLEIGGATASTYESVYFDTPDLLSYRMAVTSRRRRFKLRTRSYLDTEEAYLEVKTRGARSLTVKDRLLYDIDQRDELTVAGLDYAAAALAGIGLVDERHDVDDLGLAPTLRTRYRRATLLLADGASRATIDTDLAWETDTGRTLALPDAVIVETKSAGRISELDRLLWTHGVRPSSVSKYGTGMAALHPSLPAHKWTRVLRRYFADAARTSRAGDGDRSDSARSGSARAGSARAA